MAYTYKLDKKTNISFGDSYASGIITADATAIPSMNVTASAGGYANITCNDNTGFKQCDLIQLNGGGTAGANMLLFLTVIGRADTTVDTTKFCIRQHRPVITAVGPVAVSPYYKVWTRFRPTYIELFNKTTLIKYSWKYGDNENTKITTTALGAVSSDVDTGIVPGSFGFAFHPTLLAPNESMTFLVLFPNKGNI